MIINPGRLYLLKDEGKQDIFVDFHHPLHQHQIDGLRSLCRLYKKKKPGVILNDPSGYGKCIQTVLFVNAVRPLLHNRPVFILCNENDVDNWRDNFSKWTDCSDDVAIESTNPFSKKLIYINTVKDALAFCRRHWSIIVVHDNSFTKDILHVDFKADFKIWLTSVHMKENLQKFSLLYQWLYPNEKLRIEEFTAKKNDTKDVLLKSIILDTFLEDIVVRRDDFKTPYKTRETYQPAILESPLKRTKKNKDPTGMKVKRSKKQITHDDGPVENTTTNTTSISDNDNFSDRSMDFSTISTGTKINRLKKRIIYDDEDDSVEDTEINNKTVSDNKGERSKDFRMISTGTKPLRSKRLIIHDDEDDITLESEKTTSDSSVSNKNSDVTNDISTNTDNLFNFVKDDPKNDAMYGEMFIYDEKPVQSDGFKYNTSDENAQEYKIEDPDTYTDFRIAIDDIIENENNEQHNVAQKDTQQPEVTTTTTTEKFQLENKEFSILKELNAVIIKQDDTEVSQRNKIEDNYVCSDTNITIKEEKSDNITITDNIKDIPKVNEADESKSSDIKLETNGISKETSNSGGHKDIYKQLAELEEQALKRFKGTYLDRLF